MAVRTENLQVSPRALAPGTEVNGWRILEPVGNPRRYGATYRVESVIQPGALGALKLARELEDERVGRELGLLMSRVSHPHVARLRASGRWPDPVTGALYFVMDWVPGLSLEAWADSTNPSIRSVVDKLATVALTLEHLHGEGILHRDLKPEHILVRQPDGKPILIDFGVWRYVREEEDAPPPEMVLGTPYLMTPEAVAFWRQHGGKPGVHYPYKPTDDVYALGVCAYRALTGRWPLPRFLARRQMFDAVTLFPPHPPEQLNRRLPRALSEVVQRMMAKQVRERFQSAGEAHAALVAAVSFAGSEALEIPLYTPEPKLQQPARPARPRARTSWMKGMGVGMALGAVTAVAGFTTHSRRVEKPTGPEGPRAALAAEGTECSRDALWNMRWYAVGTLRLRPPELASHKGSRVIEVRDSEQIVWTMDDPWTSRIPAGSQFHGRIWVRDRLYGRFDLVVFPDGKRLPVCMEFWKSEYAAGAEGESGGLRFVPGIALAEPSSQPGVGRVDIQDIEADLVPRWGSLKEGEAAGSSPKSSPLPTQRGK
ncbi:MAG TPA: serine/threonine-protein kinase [Myxococcaceae bacterium]|jgi:serine/threonine-protein kinase